MLILLFFAFISGLVTILAPCIWPLLPIILSASTTGGRSKSMGITVGIMVSFAFFTLAISYIVKIIPFDPNWLRIFAVIVISFLGLTLIIPKLNQLVEGFVSALSAKTGAVGSKKRSGFGGGFVTGFSLGIVWSPCAGPILATIATLAATQAVNFQVILVTIAYVIGVGIPLFIFSILGQTLFKKSRTLNKYTGTIQQVFGVIMLVTALAILTNYDKVAQAKLLNLFPSYSGFLTSFEGSADVQKQLNALKGIQDQMNEDVTNNQLLNVSPQPAPDFVGITHWLNTDKPLHMSNLKGKVVLVDFWTYTCINCIRTLPHVTSWYEKYKNQGFVVIGVHTPEFEFEKNTDNVKNALKQYNINYPVAQDNDYGTWSAYSNQYWPAEYLIDAQGNVRRFHAGEGEYDESEKAIQVLLKEAGNKVNEGIDNMPDQTPTTRNTPETYVGSKRIERFASNEQASGGEQSFTLPESVPTHYFGFDGKWDVEPEYSVPSQNVSLVFHFYAGQVFLVLKPQNAGDTVKVLLDDKPISAAAAGNDVKKSEVVMDKSRLYSLVNLHGKAEDHTLKLIFENGGTQVYAFTFGT